MKHKWTQPYPGESKYERLFRAQRILQLSRHVMLLDTVEPVTNLTVAKEYLKKFQLGDR
jgi:hypothetical protein